MDAKDQDILNGLKSIDPDKLWGMIAERAYFKAEKRCFVPGLELDDWLKAESEICNQCLYWHLEIE